MCSCNFCFLPQLDDWLERLIEEKGEDLYRYKGVLSVNGSDQRYVLQVLAVTLFYSLALVPHHLPPICFKKKTEGKSEPCCLYASGCTHYVRWLPRKNMGFWWEEDKQIGLHRTWSGWNCSTKGVQRMFGVMNRECRIHIRVCFPTTWGFDRYAIKLIICWVRNSCSCPCSRW